MPYDQGDVAVIIRDVSVRDARLDVGRLGGSLAMMQAGGDPAGGLVNGHFDEGGNWIPAPIGGVLVFGPPGLG